MISPLPPLLFFPFSSFYKSRLCRHNPPPSFLLFPFYKDVSQTPSHLRPFSSPLLLRPFSFCFPFFRLTGNISVVDFSRQKTIDVFDELLGSKGNSFVKRKRERIEFTKTNTGCTRVCTTSYTYMNL